MCIHTIFCCYTPLVENRIKKLKLEKDILFSATIFESFSYHEVLIILKSNSVTALKNIILELRGLKISDIEGIHDKNIISNSLFRKLQNNDVSNASEIHNHIFESSITSFGIKCPAEEWQKKRIINPIENESFIFLSKWNIKPGHTKRVIDIINTVIENKRLNVELSNTCFEFEKFQVTGKGDLIVKMKVEAGCKENLNFPQMFFENTDLHEHIRETYTSVGFDDGIEGGDYNKSDHHDIHGKLSSLIFDEADVDKLSAKAKALWLPKPLTEKVLRIVTSFNGAVLNPDMYVFYSELRAYIDQSVFQTVDLYYQNKLTGQHKTVHLINKLETACENIEIGFQNRYYQSYWTTEFPEINTNFSGGLHNMVTSYDACYKSLNSIFRIVNNQDVSFLNITSNSRVQSDYDVLAINIFYLVHPYLFSSIALHEALNFSIDKYSRDFYEDGNDNTKEGIRKVFNFIKEAKISVYLREYENLLNKDLQRGTETSDIYRDIESIDRNLNYKMSLLINEVCLRYLITDYLNFKIGFDGDFELFKKVRWDHFYQSSFVYNSPGKVNETYYLTLTIRLALIKSVLNGGHLTENDYDGIVPEWEIIKPNKDKFREDVPTLISSLYFASGINQWLKSLPSILSSENLAFLKERWVSPVLVECTMSYISGIISVEDLWIKYLKTVVGDNQNGKVKTVNEMEAALNQTSFNVIYVSIMNAILRIYSQKSDILTRKINTGDPVVKGADNFLMDPCGSIFTTGKNERENYLSSRIRIYRLLFHIGQLQKMTYITGNTPNVQGTTTALKSV